MPQTLGDGKFRFGVPRSLRLLQGAGVSSVTLWEAMGRVYNADAQRLANLRPGAQGPLDWKQVSLAARKVNVNAIGG